MFEVVSSSDVVDFWINGGGKLLGVFLASVEFIDLDLTFHDGAVELKHAFSICVQTVDADGLRLFYFVVALDEL